MAINCDEKLTAAISKNCDEKPQAGIEVNVVIINYDDIDFAASTFDGTDDLLLTNLATDSGTQGYFIEGIKQTQGVSFELVKKEESFDGFKHKFEGVILEPSVENKQRLSELSAGGRFVVVVEKKWKGVDDEDAFEVLGWNAGMEIETVIWNSKEADGIIKFSLASVDGFEETKMTYNLLETDYATTKTAFDGFFATA